MTFLLFLPIAANSRLKEAITYLIWQVFAANRAVTNLDLIKKHRSTANTHLKHDATVTSFIVGVCSIFMHLIKFRWVTAPLAADT